MATTGSPSASNDAPGATTSVPPAPAGSGLKFLVDNNGKPDWLAAASAAAAIMAAFPEEAPEDLPLLTAITGKEEIAVSVKDTDGGKEFSSAILSQQLIDAAAAKALSILLSAFEAAAKTAALPTAGSK